MNPTTPWRVVAEVPVSRDARLYTEGWQSWSPTTWYGLHEVQHRPEAPWQHLMRFRPGTALPEQGFQAEGLLVVDPGEGGPVHVVGHPDPADDVPTVRAEVRQGVVVITANRDVPTTTATDAATGLADFGRAAAAAAGGPALRPAPRVWCSWYRYFEDVTAADIEENLAAFEVHDLPVDVVQIDDGWSLGTGEWMRPREGFGSLPGLVDAIRATGRRAGIWLAPFLVGARSSVARERPEWLVGPAGHNWGQDLVGLDLTHPGVQEYLADVLHRLRDLGIDYFKIDFVYAGAVPGTRYAGEADAAAGVRAYRAGLRLVRGSVGPEPYVVGCGAPILPSVGLVDAMRVSPDTFHEGAEDGSAGLRGRMSLEARAWQHGRLWVNDPDCLVARPSFTLREEWADVVRRPGWLRSFSDRVDELDAWGLRATQDLLRDETGLDHLPPPDPRTTA